MVATGGDYARVTFDLMGDIDRTKTPEQVVERLASSLSTFGYSPLLITGMPEPPQRVEPYFLLNGWPKRWTERHANENYHIEDPVAAWRRRTINPFEWSEADSGRAARAAEFVRAAEDVGMKKAFVVPIIRASGFTSCVTMAGETPDFEPRTRRAVHLVSLYAHAKAVSLLGTPTSDARPRRQLTRREREVMQWIAAGKSSWDISVILGISERTVNWLIARAVRRLDAVNRTQAVVNAIRSGEVQI